MTTIEDVTGLVAQYGGEQFSAGAGQCADELAKAQADLAASQAAYTAEAAALDAAMKRIEELTGTQPVTHLPFGIGMNDDGGGPLYSPAALEKEAGAKFAYMRAYYTYPTSGVHATSVAFADKHLKAGRIPVLSYKLPGDDWQGAGNGKYDAAIDATNDALEALVVQYRDAGFANARVLEAENHEMDNDGKPLSEYLDMTRHLLPIVRRPGRIEYWHCFTGWAQIFGKPTFSFDALNMDGIDGYAIDPYVSMFQKPSNTSKSTLTDLPTAYFAPFAKWCDAHGKQKAVWETGFTAPAQASTNPKIKTLIADHAKAAADLGFTAWIYWNRLNPSTGNDWRISDIMPANSHAQMVAALKTWAWK